MRLIRPRKARADAVSALLATGLWMLVAGERTVERTMRIPLEFTNLPPRLERLATPPTRWTCGFAARRPPWAG